jgi:PBSX family phage terminase large subunit
VEPLAGKAVASARLATHRINIWDGAVRSSKTVSSIVAFTQFARTGPPGALGLFGRTRDTVRRNVIDPLVEMLGPSRARWRAGVGELDLCGRTVYVVGLNDEAAADKIRGMTLAGAYVDEITVIPQSSFRMILSRLSVDGARLFGTTNPDGPRHWLKVDYLDRANLTVHGNGNVTRHTGTDRLDLARFCFRLTDNPHLPTTYIDALRLEYTGLWRRRFIDGDWTLAEGVIYDAFDPDTHVIPPTTLPPITRYWVGIDHGTRNPFSAVLLGLARFPDGQNRLIAVDEWRHDSRTAHNQITNPGYSLRVRTWLAGHDVTPEWTFVDPAAADFRIQLWQDGLPGVTTAINDVVPGIRTVAALLAADRLRITTRCKGLLDELPAYTWDPKAAARGEDAPVKVDDHSVDALRYAAHSSAWTWRHDIDLTTITPPDPPTTD